jgi:hypothetical protein
MLILFDQGTPRPLKKYLPVHQVKTAWEMGWSEIENGQLLEVAEKSGFELLLTTDSNLQYQQNLSTRRISLLILLNTDWRIVEKQVQVVVQAIDRATPNSYEEISFSIEPKSRR